MDRKALLQELVDARFDGSQAEFARSIKRSPAQVHQWLSGHRSLGDAGARHIELSLGLDAGYFDNKRPGRTLKLLDFKREPMAADEFTIPHLAVTGSMGPGTDLLEVEEVIERMTLKGEWLRKNLSGCSAEDLAIISGKGNSMTPTFNDGDLLLVDCGVRRVEIDGVYVLSALGRLFIKTVRQRLDGSYEISSDNPSVKTVDVLNGDHEVLIHGRVVWAWNGKKL